MVSRLWPSPELLDHSRLEVDEILGDVGHPIGDALEVMGDEDELGGGVDALSVGGDGLDENAEGLAVGAIDGVVAGRDPAALIGAACDHGAEHATDLLAAGASDRAEVHGGGDLR